MTARSSYHGRSGSAGARAHGVRASCSGITRAHHGGPGASMAGLHHGRTRYSGLSRGSDRRFGAGASGMQSRRFHSRRSYTGRRRPVPRSRNAGRRKPVRRRGRRCNMMRPRRRRCDNDGRRQHGNHERSTVVARGGVTSRAHADAAGINAARPYGHTSRHVRPVGVVGAAGKSENHHGGKKPALHGSLLRACFVGKWPDARWGGTELCASCSAGSRGALRRTLRRRGPEYGRRRFNVKRL